ncbi:Acetate permease ActP (cation/acetate symporter) [hydrothermal vent metagenome]|uniref:Acetate permease ActP (Cation/acetate symporter) n=1 Tax=hydrothermal vent metagenome TaxID=652676 RepID=A0A3B0TY31_9ZZZZ
MALQPNRLRNEAKSMANAFWLLFAVLAAFVAVMMIFEFVGVPRAVIAFLFIAVTFVAYVLIGAASRTLQVVEFFVAGRRIPAVFNGMAAAANWIGSTTLFGLAGALIFMGFDGLVFLLGWTGGFVLVAVLFAPYLRKYGAFSVPDFLAARFGGAGVRLCGVVVLVASAAALMTAEFYAGGLIVSRLAGVDFQTGVLVTFSVVLFCIVWGGIRGATWTQSAQYIVLGTAIVLPVTLFAIKLTGNPVAPAALGGLLDQIGAAEARYGIGSNDAPAVFGELKRFSVPHLEAFATYSAGEFAAIALCLMLGTASMPHMLMRYFTSTSVADARRAVGWSLFFVVMIFAFLPVAAALVKLTILTDIIGRPFSELPAWVAAWADQGLVRAFDADGNGRLGITEFFMHPDAVLLALPQIGGLPYVLTAIVGVGILAAAISTASGLVLAVSNGFSHDLHYRLVQPSSSTAKRLVIARLTLVLVATGTAWLAINRAMDILPLIAWSLSLAAAGNFAVLVLAIWWKNCTRWGAIAGMVSGFGVTLTYLIGLRFGGWAPVLGLGELAAGLLGVATGFTAAIGVSLVTPAPTRDTLNFIDDIRTPRGQSFMERERAAERIREAGSTR